MRLCVEKVKPDGIIHLGDYYEDGTTIMEENPGLPFWQVPGNCDRYRCFPLPQEILTLPIAGVRLFITHGHKHGVKLGLWRLLEGARSVGADAALYGHTHEADCHRETDGLWVLNPGSCGGYGGSAGLITIEDGRIRECRLLHLEDLEKMQ